jgi:hypothetical protein
MSEELELVEGKKDNIVLNSFKSVAEYEILMRSGTLPENINTIERLMAVVQTGKELGFPVSVSVNGISVIKGKTVISASLIGALLKRNKVDWVWTKDYFVSKNEDNSLRIETEIELEWISVATGKVKLARFCVTMAQMDLAGYTAKDNWKRMPKEINKDVSYIL